MPELPEVETSRRGIEPWIVDQTITGVTVRDRRLRWPVPRDIEARLLDRTIDSVGRRAKYLLLNTDTGSAVVHLGMTGSVFIVDRGTPAGVHDHYLAAFGGLTCLDGRRVTTCTTADGLPDDPFVHSEGSHWWQEGARNQHGRFPR